MEEKRRRRREERYRKRDGGKRQHGINRGETERRRQERR
jgi:hypothetical protein